MSTATDLQTAPQAGQHVAVVAMDASESPEWARIMKDAEKLALAPLTPAHLKVAPAKLMHIADEERRARLAWQQTIANCILVVNQSHRWDMDFFAVAACTYVVGNKLGYEGKLIAAVVNTRAKLSQPLRPLYSTGKGDAFAAVIFGKKDGEVPSEAFPLLERYADDEDRKALRELDKLGVLAVRISVSQAKTQNDMWRKDPEQKLWYSGATKWARRFAPEVMLGVMTREDIEYVQEHEQPTPERAESRVNQVIPATLDASGITSRPEENWPTHAEQQPDSDEKQPEVAAEETTKQPAPEPTDDQRIAEVVEDYRVLLEETESVIECGKMGDKVAAFAAENPWFAGEPVEAVKTMAKTRADQIRNSRGQKGGNGR